MPSLIVDYNILMNATLNQTKPRILFFGSFLEYSANVLEQLNRSDLIEIIGVVTTPPKPAGRQKELNYTHVHQFALKHNLPVFTPEQLDDVSLTSLHQGLGSQPDLLVVAGYGKLLPQSWLEFPTIAPINIHFSLLPKYRGAMPGEWAIFMGETETGVSLIEMSSKLDAGAIISQVTYQIKADENRESLYHQLYNLGADLFLSSLPAYLEFKTGLPGLKPRQQTKSIPPFARLINKDETKVEWQLVKAAINGQSPDINLLSPLLTELPTKSLTTSDWAAALDRMIRAFYGWPGIWTEVQINGQPKRLKLISSQILNSKLSLKQVQLEGKNITNFTDIKHLLD